VFVTGDQRRAPAIYSVLVYQHLLNLPRPRQLQMDRKRGTEANTYLYNHPLRTSPGPQVENGSARADAIDGEGRARGREGDREREGTAVVDRTPFRRNLVTRDS